MCTWSKKYVKTFEKIISAKSSFIEKIERKRWVYGFLLEWASPLPNILNYPYISCIGSSYYGLVL